MQPDFIIIPYPLLQDKELTPLDRIVYGVVYWLEHLKDGACTASDLTIAGIVYSSKGAVSNTITKLKRKKYIIIEKANRPRIIKTAFAFRYSNIHQIMNATFTKELRQPSLNNEENNNIDKEKRNVSPFLTQVITYWYETVRDSYGTTPIISPKDAMVAKRALKYLTIEQAKEIIDYYLESKKVKEFGFNLSVALSSDTINRWKHDNEANA